MVLSLPQDSGCDVIASLPTQKRAPFGAPLKLPSPVPAPVPLPSLLGGRNLVQRIPPFAVPQGLAGLGLNIAEDEVVDVTADESVNDEAHFESIGGHGGGLDGGRGLIDLGAR